MQNTSFELPELFLQRIRFDKNWFVLVKVSYSLNSQSSLPSQKLWNFELIEWPLQQLDGCIWRTNGQEKCSEKFFLKNSPPCKIERTGNYLDSGIISIYEYQIDRPSSVLPIAYYKARAGEEPEGQWWFNAGDYMDFFLEEGYEQRPDEQRPDEQRPDEQRPDEQRQVQQNSNHKIPPHVFKILVETMVARKEVCPISMESLQIKTTAGLPCGHLFEEFSLTQALEQKMECPICRGSVLEGDIQKLI
jgi:hypothetical protein